MCDVYELSTKFPLRRNEMKLLKLIVIVGIVLTSCSNKKEVNASSEQSHGKFAKPNHSIVFPNDKVNRIDIKIDAEKWTEMQADLKSNVIESIHKMPPPQRVRNKGHQMENQNTRLPKRERKMGSPPGHLGRPGSNKKIKPIWSYCDINFNNKKWSKVGIRFKGNSSLRNTYMEGLHKFSFKLDFEQFDDEFTEIKDQRFYGFRQLNLKNNFGDKSFIREKIASDLFADFGLVTPKTAFYQLFVDFGEGPQYFGLYTMVEEVDDTVVETGFSSEDGNLYKPEGRAATFAQGSFRTADMNKKTNKKSDDYSDVEHLNTIINSSLRLENYDLWKSEFNEIFDVPVFLKWLAVNTVIQNWDTYGSSIHNFYLYNNPASNKLVWIPWDNNEAFQKGKMRGAPSLSFDEIGDDWPLIRYILNDEDWANEYKMNVTEFSGKYFTPEKMNEIYSNYEELLTDYVIGERGEKTNYTFLENESDFNDAIDFLKQHVIERKIAVQEFVSK